MPNSDYFQGKKALITGGAKRLGRETALALARAGTHLAIHYNTSRDPAEALCETLEEMGVRAVPVEGNLDELDRVEGVFHEAWEALDGVDLLVNNASIFPSGRMEEMTFQDLQPNLRVNAWAPFLLSRALWRKIRDTDRRASVVNLLDTRLVGKDLAHAPYHLSKAVLAELTVMMALEFAPEIQVNGVAPGAVLPPEELDEAYLEGLTRELPLKRRGYPSDIVDAILYLLKASFVTGQVIFVDGGRAHPDGRKHMSDRILIKDLLVRGIIGIHDWEREKKQDILINIVMEADCRAAGLSDDFHDAVDYRAVAKRVLALVENSAFFLVEKMAEEIAGICLEDERVEVARVRVEKPGAVRFSASVGVEVERRQSVRP